MKKITKGLTILSTFIMAISALGGTCAETINVKAAGNVNVSNPRIAEDGTVSWDKVTFGSYPQAAEYKEEPIKWRILDIDKDGNAFLLADEALDCRQYNESGVERISTFDDSDGEIWTDYSCTWETCTLRDWLNGTDEYKDDKNSFINAAFSEEERKAIIETQIVNDNNPYYDPDNTEEPITGEGGNDTIDKIYLLSAEEVSDSRYGFVDTGNLGDSKMRAAKPTDYAYINGADYWTYTDDDYWYGKCDWWLRSPGDTNRAAMCVFIGGSIDYGGDVVNNEGYFARGGDNAVRPVLHVNLSHVTDAGKVMSNGNYTAGTNRTTYSKPMISGEVTTWDCVYFGHYKQKADFKKMPIEWRVLFVNGNDALVIADKALDCKPFNNENKQCTWETCTLRDWLNGTDHYTNDSTSFINAAFTDDERKAILETSVKNDSDDGSSTVDKIYLLSFKEAYNTAYGFDTVYDNNGTKEKAKTREAKASDYARINGASRSIRSDYAGNGTWWLRSPGYVEAENPSVFSISWEENYGGINVDNKNITVRPILHVDISSPFVNVSGEVKSESNITKEDIASQEKVAQEEAQEVIKRISEIGTVAEGSKTSIEEARKAYNELMENVKNLVTNYSVLQAAEKNYADIVEKNAKANEGKGNNNGKTDKPSGAQDTTTEQQVTEQQTTTETKITAPSKTKISYLKNKKAKSLTVTWKKVKKAQGYEVQFALDKKFKKNKKSKTTTKLSVTVKKLKKGKKYFVRVRAYKKASDGSKVNGKWSDVKKIKIRK